MMQESPFTPLDEQTTLRSQSQSEEQQNWVPMATAGALLASAYLLRRHIFRPRTLWLLAGMGLAQALRKWPASSAPHIPLRGLVRAQATMTINRMPDDLFKMWADVERTPEWMERVQKVERSGERTSKWTFELPGGRTISWTSEITTMEPGRKLAWRTVPGSLATLAGQVIFEPSKSGRGTIVRLTEEFLMPGGPLGVALSGLFARTPSGFVRENLRHFKQLAETGEIPTTKGQPHGPRSGTAHVERAAMSEEEQKAPAIHSKSSSGATPFPERRTA